MDLEFLERFITTFINLMAIYLSVRFIMKRLR